MEGAPQQETGTSAESAFPVEREYTRCVVALHRTGILTLLPVSEQLGVIGIDGAEHPLPSQEQVVALFNQNRDLVAKKFAQGFDQLALVPLAMPIPALIQRLQTTILRHEANSEIFRTRRCSDDRCIPVRVNSQTQVWVWKTLSRAFDTQSIVYFPQEYSDQHWGMPKLDAIYDERICALPGWSVQLVESLPVMPQPGQGRVVDGRPQLEIGLSPREYLEILKKPAYEGETGSTLEDFITRFLIHLELTNEVSHDVEDHNALWCLGQYMRVPYAELVPTGRWYRRVGRVRLDMHRTGNKQCTKSWGASTVVRLMSA
jgi:hypothetical protein